MIQTKIQFSLSNAKRYFREHLCTGDYGGRTTGNLVGVTFRHETSRELDPHLHTHCIVFNATFDAAENRWKALETADMYRAQSFAANLYRHELCRGLHGLGYEIENHARGFEIKGVPASVVALFSKRHRQIEARRKGVRASKCQIPLRHTSNAAFQTRI